MEQLELLPAARMTDPPTSHAAARAVKAGNTDLTNAIRKALIVLGPMDAWHIADAVQDAHGDRWAHDTVRTAIARVPGVRKLKFESISPRGHACAVYEMQTETIVDTGGRL